MARFMIAVFIVLALVSVAWGVTGNEQDQLIAAFGLMFSVFAASAAGTLVDEGVPANLRGAERRALKVRARFALLANPPRK